MRSAVRSSNGAESKVKAQKFTLLVVDDEEGDRFFIERTFKKLDTHYRVHGIGCGNAAIAYIKGEGEYADRDKFQFPSYVITDLKMPKGDGFAVLEFIKQNPALSIIPVVVLSASDDPDDIRQAYLLGASSYFCKAIDSQKYKEVIRKIHDYWSSCEVPAVDEDGYALMTDSKGKLGERFIKPQRVPV
jgi:CheY-like chemotaxis protein